MTAMPALFDENVPLTQFVPKCVEWKKRNEPLIGCGHGTAVPSVLFGALKSSTQRLALKLPASAAFEGAFGRTVPVAGSSGSHLTNRICSPRHARDGMLKSVGANPPKALIPPIGPGGSPPPGVCALAPATMIPAAATSTTPATRLILSLVKTVFTCINPPPSLTKQLTQSARTFQNEDLLLAPSPPFPDAHPLCHVPAARGLSTETSPFLLGSSPFCKRNCVDLPSPIQRGRFDPKKLGKAGL